VGGALALNASPPGSAKKLSKTAVWRSAGSGTETVSAESQLDIRSQATRMVNGLRNALAFDATRTNARKLGHDNPTRDVRFSLSSSQSRPVGVQLDHGITGTKKDVRADQDHSKPSLSRCPSVSPT